MYEDIFFALLAQGNEYKSNYAIIFSFLKKYAFTLWVPSLIITVIYYRITRKTYKIIKSKFKFRLQFYYLIFPFLLSAIYFFSQIFIPLPVSNSNSFFFQAMINPSSKLLQFPEKKKNIILIDLESMDSAFLSTKNGGCMDESLIPYLEELALDKNNIHFTNTSYPKLGGMSIVSRTEFSTGSTFGVLCGAPFMGDNYKWGRSHGYLDKLTCMSNLLQDEDYILSATFGSTFGDWGFGNIFRKHNFDKINTRYQIERDIHNEYVKDFATYSYFKRELNYLHKSRKPFLAFITTSDTHEPGIECDYCPKNISQQLFKTVRCANNQIKEFLEWAKLQEWYNNTVIVIYGDHVSRDVNVIDIAKAKNMMREAYIVFINSEVKANKTYERKFIAYDLFPSILAATGVKIKDNRLGLGVNIFSNESTLLEKYQDKFVSSFSDTTYWYETVILNKPAQCDGFTPCISIENFTQI